MSNHNGANMNLVMPTSPASRLVRLEKCETCKFHGNQPAGGGIDCRKEPVKSAIVPDPRGTPAPISYFPPVLPDWWCGEWKPRIEMGKPS